MSVVGRKVVPDKERLNRERPSCTGKCFLYFFIRTGTESKRWSVHRDRMTGMVAGYHKRNGKGRLLS